MSPGPIRLTISIFNHIRLQIALTIRTLHVGYKPNILRLILLHLESIGVEELVYVYYLLFANAVWELLVDGVE